MSNRRWIVSLPARARTWSGGTIAPWVVLFLMIAAYFASYTYWSVRSHAGFQTGAFDIGIYDQGVWLLSRFQEPFVTVRGLNLFADHSTFILLLVAPLYWVWASPILLLVTQSLALGFAAVPLYLLTRDLLGSAWLGVAVAAVLLLNPAIGWTNLENFHPDSYEVLFLTAALYFMVKQRWGWFLLSISLLLLVKEDVPLLVIPLGIYIDLRYKSWVGFFTGFAAAACLVLNFFVLIPWFGEGSSVYWGRLPFGGPAGLLRTTFTDPSAVLAFLQDSERVSYVVDHLRTLAFLPLLSPLALVAIGPLALNVLSTHTYMHLINYHYSTLIVPPLVVAAVFTISRFDSLRMRAKLVAILVVATLVSAYLLGPLPYSRVPVPPVTVDTTRNEAIRAAIALVPKDAIVSAHYSIVPHIAHRQEIYYWPNPFRAENWADGSKEGQRLPMADDVEYVVLFPDQVDGEYRAIYEGLKARSQVVFNREGVEILHIRAP
jgi:Predicted membrane protein